MKLGVFDRPPTCSRLLLGVFSIVSVMLRVRLSEVGLVRSTRARSWIVLFSNPDFEYLCWRMLSWISRVFPWVTLPLSLIFARLGPSRYAMCYVGNRDPTVSRDCCERLYNKLLNQLWALFCTGAWRETVHELKMDWEEYRCDIARATGWCGFWRTVVTSVWRSSGNKIYLPVLYLNTGILNQT